LAPCVLVRRSQCCGHASAHLQSMSHVIDRTCPKCQGRGHQGPGRCYICWDSGIDEAQARCSKGCCLKCQTCEGSGKAHGVQADVLGESVNKALAFHGIGTVPAAPPDAELWNMFHSETHTQKESKSIENRFYAGYSHNELDQKKAIHGIIVDFKGDGMQLGMVIQRFEESNEQYVFIGNPLPNGGWHFSAVNDFEDEAEQKELDPLWTNRRIWHRVGYVPSTTQDGRPALTPREEYNPDDKTKGAIPIDPCFKLASLIFTGGLMAGSLIANVVKEGTPCNSVIEKHLQLGYTTFAAIGHGLGVVIGSGTRNRSAFEGFTAAVTPEHRHLLEISGMQMQEHGEGVCLSEKGNRNKLVSASFWGKQTVEAWFDHLHLPKVDNPLAPNNPRVLYMPSEEQVFTLDLSRTIPGSIWDAESVGKPLVAVVVDYKFDPHEGYSIIKELSARNINFQFISHGTETPKERRPVRSASSLDRDGVRLIRSETISGNARYAIHDCCLTLPTTPSNLVQEGTHFDAFCLVGGQGPFHMLDDDVLKAIISKTKIGSAICHGPMALLGTKWIPPKDLPGPQFTSYLGCWIYFRDVIKRFATEKPGFVCADEEYRLYTGNSPLSSKEFATQFCMAVERGVSE